MTCHRESGSPLRMFQRLESVRTVGLGAPTGREMGADSRTQSPGELSQSRLQDTNASSQSKQLCTYSLIHLHAHFRAWKKTCITFHAKNYIQLERKFKFWHLHPVRLEHSCFWVPHDHNRHVLFFSENCYEGLSFSDT